MNFQKAYNRIKTEVSQLKPVALFIFLVSIPVMAAMTHFTGFLGYLKNLLAMEVISLLVIFTLMFPLIITYGFYFSFKSEIPANDDIPEWVMYVASFLAILFMITVFVYLDPIFTQTRLSGLLDFGSGAPPVEYP